ncbi:hypothetical protein [Ensifer adhaerens]|uniref:hypothetical protein n=1 Tax=Ensifer adhaerens TaxID=106592 RepID=UPI003F83286E
MRKNVLQVVHIDSKVRAKLERFSPSVAERIGRRTFPGIAARDANGEVFNEVTSGMTAVQKGRFAGGLESLADNTTSCRPLTADWCGRALQVLQPLIQRECDRNGAAAVLADPKFAEIKSDLAFSLRNFPGIGFGHAAHAPGRSTALRAACGSRFPANRRMPRRRKTASLRPLR